MRYDLDVVLRVFIDQFLLLSPVSKETTHDRKIKQRKVEIDIVRGSILAQRTASWLPMLVHFANRSTGYLLDSNRLLKASRCDGQLPLA